MLGEWEWMDEVYGVIHFPNIREETRHQCIQRGMQDIHPLRHEMNDESRGGVAINLIPPNDLPLDQAPAAT